jgi:hypothetical protein
MILQWIVAAITAFLVVIVAFLQWRTAQQKAVLDLFEERHSIYDVVRRPVGTIASNSHSTKSARWSLCRQWSAHVSSLGTTLRNTYGKFGRTSRMFGRPRPN